LKTLYKKGHSLAIIFDLDDTLIDTFSLLIKPLERLAAKAMIENGCDTIDIESMTRLLLDLRRKKPDSIPQETAIRLKSNFQRGLEARDNVLSVVPVADLSISPEVLRLLEDLRKFHRLYLITEGSPSLQNAKINKVEIRSFFEEVLIVDKDLEEEKEEKIANLLRRLNINPQNAVIVGNRLDKEIIAGNKLKIPTIWVIHGEGSEIRPGKNTGKADKVVQSVLELRKFLIPNIVRPL
jgi:putative hydrolase of the HAD superfamily